jgi:multiple sugar transport system substrate-binding protein
MRPQLLKALTNGTSIDLISIDQIWLGEFVENGLITDLTDSINKYLLLDFTKPIGMEGV